MVQKNGRGPTLRCAVSAGRGRLLWPVRSMATRSGTLARIRLRVAVPGRLLACRPGRRCSGARRRRDDGNARRRLRGQPLAGQHRAVALWTSPALDASDGDLILEAFHKLLIGLAARG